MSLSGIWTSRGIDKLAAQAAGGPALTIDKIALGDGGGMVPAVLPSQKALLKEVWRGLVNAVLVEADTPNAVTVEAVIPYSVGGFHIREWGLFDTDGDLLAVGPHAEFYKPLLAEGSGAELLERIQLPLANAGQVNLTISSEALATRKFVEQTATIIATEAVKTHDGDADAHGGMSNFVKTSRSISVSTPLTGGGDLSANRTIGINASAAPLNNYAILRDAEGRAQVSAPAVPGDIARKADVDAAVATKAMVVFSAAGTRTATVAANTNYTVPSYVVGSGRLLVFLDGIKCAAGTNAAQHQYKEVGTAGAASMVIQWHQPIDKTYDIEARVR